MKAPSDSELQHSFDAILGAEPQPEDTLRALAGLRQATLRWKQAIWYGRLSNSRVGPLLVAVGPHGLVALEFGQDEAAFAERLAERSGAPVWPSTERVARAIEQLDQYFDGRRREFELPVDLSRLTPFQRQVLKAAIQVPAGVVATYGEIARRIGKPGASRAVGQALARNPIPIVVPCHRVVAADGSLTGYSGGAGVETKRKLLALEGATLA